MFSDRAEAGRALAARLEEEALADAVVVALPRGGLPVAAEVADALDLPLDIVLVRKVGAPGQPELAVGAVSDGGGMQLTINRDVASALALDDDDVAELARRELPELERRQNRYRGGRDQLAITDRTVIVIDDGVATGATARAALRILRQRGAARIVLALPVAPQETVVELEAEADSVICLQAPTPFYAVGAHYLDFSQVSDSAAIEILEQAHRRMAGRGREGGRPAGNDAP